MTTLNVGGHKVKVGDEFWSMDQKGQEAAIDEIAKSLGVTPAQPDFRADQQGRATRMQRERMDAPISRVESFMEGAKQGATLNTSDEIAALKSAGTPEALKAQPQARMGLIGSGLAAAAGGARMLAEKIAPGTFGSGGGQAYQEELARQRFALDQAREANPGTMLAGEVISSLAVPVPAAGAVAQARAGGSMLKAMGYGATGGAAIGAGAGFGAGEGLPDSAQKAGTGALVGAGVGAVAVPAVAGIQSAGGLIADATRGVTSRFRGVVNPEAEALRRAQTAFQRDAQNGQVMSGQQFAGAVDNGQPLVTADLAGENTRALMRSAANTSAAGREKIGNAIADRYESQSDRAAGFLKTFGPADTAAARDALQSRAKASNRPAYKQAYEDGSQGVWNETLAEIASTPLGQQAMKDAMVMARNRAPIDGFPPPPNPFVTGPDGVMQLKPGATPTIQYWDHVQRSLREAANKGDSNAGQLRTMLNRELDAAVPSFNTARTGAAKFFGAEDALDAGVKFAGAGKMNHGEAMAAMRKMTPEDLDLFRQGFLSELTDRIGKLGDTRDLTKAIMQSPDARNRVTMVLGPKGTEKLEAFIEVEKAMNATKAALGNSTTARQLYELGMAGGGAAGGYAYGGDAQSAAAGALLQKGMRFGANKIDGRVSEEVAKLLSSGKPEDWAKVIELASKSKNVMQSIRDASSYITQLTAPQGSGAPMPALLSGPRMAPAEDQSRQQP